MAARRFTATLDLTPTGAVPAIVVSLSVDASGDDKIQPGESVPMASADGKKWVGYFSVDNPAGVLFFLQFIAPKGTGWSFTIVDGQGASAHETRNQTTKMVKEILADRMGAC